MYCIGLCRTRRKWRTKSILNATYTIKKKTNKQLALNTKKTNQEILEKPRNLTLWKNRKWQFTASKHCGGENCHPKDRCWFKNTNKIIFLAEISMGSKGTTKFICGSGVQKIWFTGSKKKIRVLLFRNWHSYNLII